MQNTWHINSHHIPKHFEKPSKHLLHLFHAALWMLGYQMQRYYGFKKVRWETFCLMAGDQLRNQYSFANSGWNLGLPHLKLSKNCMENFMSNHKVQESCACTWNTLPHTCLINYFEKFLSLQLQGSYSFIKSKFKDFSRTSFNLSRTQNYWGSRLSHINPYFPNKVHLTAQETATCSTETAHNVHPT